MKEYKPASMYNNEYFPLNCG